MDRDLTKPEEVAEKLGLNFYVEYGHICRYKCSYRDEDRDATDEEKEMWTRFVWPCVHGAEPQENP
jgi:hypothetical protein